PRLLMFHICSEVIRTKRREVELGGSMRKFLDRIGIGYGGHQWRSFKEQSRALAAMRMTLGYEAGEKQVVVKTDPISRFEAWMGGDNLNAQGQLWPDELVVADEFMRTLLDHAVPLDPAAIHKLQGTALGLDVYTWLAHRLCRIRKDGGIPLYWFSLRAQFGQEYRDDTNFKREFLKALKAATVAYPDARVEQVKGGIRLYPSPPPVKPKRVVLSMPAPKPAAPLRIDQIHLKPETYDKIPEAAPGWDKYHLEGLWRDWVATKAGVPNDPDKAFLVWCKKFTKGKRPS
ncbi:replication protein RepA, partial [Pseudogemmobacter sonorensis]|uniref:replication protein RepA n=1 Tax=Pseudogemmobacter sonorensis TaxID=2989681 RepID=UPI0036B78BE7